MPPGGPSPRTPNDPADAGRRLPKRGVPAGTARRPPAAPGGGQTRPRRSRRPCCPPGRSAGRPPGPRCRSCPWGPGPRASARRPTARRPGPCACAAHPAPTPGRRATARRTRSRRTARRRPGQDGSPRLPARPGSPRTRRARPARPPPGRAGCPASRAAGCRSTRSAGWRGPWQQPTARAAAGTACPARARRREGCSPVPGRPAGTRDEAGRPVLGGSLVRHQRPVALLVR